MTLLDVNEASTRSVEALVAALGGSGYVREVVRGDATIYQHPAPLHIVISETMQRTLREEPFVAILRNLRLQLVAGSLVVPEREKIELALLDAESQQRQWRGEPGPVEMENRGIVFQVDAKVKSLSNRPRRSRSAVNRPQARSGSLWSPASACTAMKSSVHVYRD